MDELCFRTARDLAQSIRAGEVSCVEVMEAHLAQIERLNPALNAIVTLLPEQGLAAAKEADAAQARGDDVGPLHGLPIAHKDLHDTKGVRTTYGSPIFAQNVPNEDALIVTRLREAGAIMIGKTNTPEFGAGSQTFNEVFGATLNPYDTTRTCGGSSGGAAVALASGMLPIADGSDMGGSLRNPASFCNVVGLRPSPGRVPSAAGGLAWGNLGVAGPMARTVGDVALVLSTIAGPDPRSPIALETPGARFAEPLERDFNGVRVAWSPDLGRLPIDPAVSVALAPQLAVLESIGCTVEEDEPDFSGADEAFKAWRAWAMGIQEPLLEAHRDRIKDTVIWNVEQGLSQSGRDLSRAEAGRSELYRRVVGFFERYDYLVCPVTQVPPFPVETRWIEEINGVAMETYIDWMKSCYLISATGLPAISVPAGFTEDGLPVGLQIVGRPRDEFSVLQLAHAFEQATQVWQRRPELV